MVILEDNLYILVTMGQRIPSSRLLFRNSEHFPGGCLTLGGLVRDSKGISPDMRVFGQYALVYLVSGSGKYIDALGTRADLRAGDSILVFPEMAHRYGPGPDQYWDEIHICFSGSIFDAWRKDGLLEPQSPLYHPGVDAKWVSKLLSIGEEPRPTCNRSNMAQISRWCGLLAELVTLPPHPDSGPKWFQQARSQIEANLSIPIDYERLARECGMSYETFRKAFVREAGISPHKYRTQVRLEAAKVLVERGELTHVVVALTLGFTDEFHFSKRFKELTGETPREYRTRVSGKAKKEKALDTTLQ